MPRWIASSATARELAVTTRADASSRRTATRSGACRSTDEPQTLRRDTATGIRSVRATGTESVRRLLEPGVDHVRTERGQQRRQVTQRRREASHARTAVRQRVHGHPALLEAIEVPPRAGGVQRGDRRVHGPGVGPEHELGQLALAPPGLEAADDEQDPQRCRVSHRSTRDARARASPGSTAGRCGRRGPRRARRAGGRSRAASK